MQEKLANGEALAERLDRIKKLTDELERAQDEQHRVQEITDRIRHEIDEVRRAVLPHSVDKAAEASTRRHRK